MARISVDYIRTLSKKKGMSISQLEEQAGLGNGTIGKWDRQMPTLTSLQKVADSLGCNVKDLILED